MDNNSVFFFTDELSFIVRRVSIDQSLHTLHHSLVMALHFTLSLVSLMFHIALSMNAVPWIVQANPLLNFNF
jgi:hypothetical protein